MGILGNIYDWSLGNCSNDGISAKHTQVCVINVDGPFEPSQDAPAVRLIKRSTGNLVCEPVGLEDRWTMFGGAFVYTGAADLPKLYKRCPVKSRISSRLARSR